MVTSGKHILRRNSPRKKRQLQIRISRFLTTQLQLTIVHIHHDSGSDKQTQRGWP